VNPQNLKKLRVPLIKTWTQSNLLSLLNLSLLLLLLLKIVRGRGKTMKRIPAPPSLPHQLPNNLLLRMTKLLTPTL
jgi:hypothetical protein